jgi:hypothetical protein
MNPTEHPVEQLIADTRAVFETETTVGRILEGTKESLERFLANPAALGQVKESLARVLGKKSIPYGQPVDQDGYGSWRLYTDPQHLFCIRPTHQRSTTSRQPHDHGELGWAVYGIMEGETVQQVYERIDDGSDPGRRRGHHHPGGRASCDCRPHGKLEHRDPQPGNGEPLAQLVRRRRRHRRAQSVRLRLKRKIKGTPTVSWS